MDSHYYVCCVFFFQPNAFEDMVYASKAFDKLVQTYPETIKCQSQNKPITEVFSPKSDAWDTPREIQPEDSVVTLASGYKSKLRKLVLSRITLKVK